MYKISFTWLDELESKVIEVVKKAANHIKDVDFDIFSKTDCTNVVTTSDINVQRFLFDELSSIMPKSGFYCEEEDLRNFQNEYVWMIDPIDGTMNYSRGIAECVISVALLHNRKPILGVVYNIWTDDVFSAKANGGAKMNGKNIRVSNRNFENSLLCTAMSLYKKELAQVCSDIIYDVYMQCNDIRRFGSCALELCYVAAGKCELYFEIRVFPWDYAAAGLILKEAGGILTDFSGKKLSYDRPTVLIGANNNANHAKLKQIVLKYLKEEPKER